MHRFSSFILIRIFGIFSILSVFYSTYLISALTVLEKPKHSSQQSNPPFYAQSEYYLAPLSSLRWLSAQPLISSNGYSELYNMEKRDSSNGEIPSRQRDIRSPLGTMRFGKRNVNTNNPLSTMRFGKRENFDDDLFNTLYQKRNEMQNSPFGTMRFGKRTELENSPLGTMRFGKRAESANSPLGTMRFGKRSDTNSPLGTMRFGK